MKKKTGREDFSEWKEFHSPSSGFFFKARRLFYQKKSSFQNIEIIENDYFGKVLLLDGLVQTTERDEFFYHEMLVHPALVMHPGPENILIIGGGDGGALKEILRYPIKNVCLTEIDAEVIEAAKKYFPWLLTALKDKRAELVIADGSEYIQETDKKFDIVYIDSSDPVGPSFSLHEKSFYEKVKRRLGTEGIVAAQVGSLFYHQNSIAENASFLKEIFKEVHFYVGQVPTYPGGNWCYVLLSDMVNPSNIERDPPSDLKYYNLGVHKAAFILPNFMRDKFMATR